MHMIVGDLMTRIALFLFLLVAVSVAGVVLLSSWHIPAPTVAIVKVIPDAELSK
mgnify:FL=1